MTSALLREAISLHQRGAVAEAATRYAQVLTREPTNVEALFYIGLARCQQGLFTEAVAALKGVVSLAPRHAGAHNLLGRALMQLGRPDEALQCFDQAIALQPNLIDAHLERANACMAMRRWMDAVDGFDRALAIAPNMIEAWCNRGFSLEQIGRYPEAIASYDRALALKPDLAEAHANRGNALAALKRDAEAVESFDRALAARPDFVAIYINRGNSLRKLLRLDAALASYDRALALQPGLIEAQFNRAAVLLELGRLGEAIEGFDRVLADTTALGQLDSSRLAAAASISNNPADLAADNDLIATAIQLRAVAANQSGRFDEVFDALERARNLAPHNESIRFQTSIIELLHGRWHEAWPKYESPERYRNALPAQFAAGPWRRWQGEAFDDGLLLLVTEQGLGDAIQFSMFATELAARGFRVAIFTSAVLAPLLATTRGIECVLSDMGRLGDLGNFRWLPLMSVPGILDTTPDTVPRVTPHLAADPARMAAWRTRLETEAINVGIAWQGSIRNLNDRFRSAPLESMAPLAAIPGIRLLSLQVGAGTEQIATVDFRDRIETPLDDIAAEGNLLLETAALMGNLDLVVTIDSMLAHLGCALGRPVFVALQQVPEWRWLLDRDDSPWYPTVRLFRQTTNGDWDAVFVRLADAVRDMVEARQHK